MQEQSKDRTPQNDTPVDMNQDYQSKTEQVYGKQGSGYPELDKKQNLDVLTSREKTGTAGEKPETNLKAMREDKENATVFMQVIPPDENDPEVKQLREETDRLREEADKNSSFQPKMGDDGEGSKNK